MKDIMWLLEVKTHKSPSKHEIAELVAASGVPLRSETPGDGGHFFSFLYDTEDEANAGEDRVEDLGHDGYATNVDEADGDLVAELMQKSWDFPIRGSE